MLANAGGTTSRLKGRFDSGRSRLAQADRIVVYLDRTQAYCPINPGRQHQEQRRRMLAGLQVRAPALKAGGRRFSSAPGKPGSSEENVSPNLVADTEQAAVANAARDYIVNAKVAGSNPAGLTPVAQG